MVKNIYLFGLLFINLSSNFILTIDTNDINQQPEFIRNIPNLSIIEGKDAYLRCSISNLGDNKIIWTFVDNQQLISIQEHVIDNRNGRISIQNIGDIYELHISNISLEDRGYYMCEINCVSKFCTSKSQVGYLNVVIPPKFDEDVLLSESNVTIREFEDVNILCSASGNPKPVVNWKREDVYLNEHHIRGNRLHIISASRQDAGVYICVASNGVQSSISRRINLIVQFAPMIRITKQMITSYLGDSVRLECQTESFPLADHYWLGTNGHRLWNSFNNTNNRKRNKNFNKYQIRLKKIVQFKYIFQLQINYLNYDDSGQYICQLSNQLGEAKSAIQLKVIERSNHQKVQTETTTINNEIKLITFKTDNKNRKTKNNEDNHLHPLSTIKRSRNQLNQLLKNSTDQFKLNIIIVLINLVFVFINL